MNEWLQLLQPSPSFSLTHNARRSLSPAPASACFSSPLVSARCRRRSQRTTLPGPQSGTDKPFSFSQPSGSTPPSLQALSLRSCYSLSPNSPLLPLLIRSCLCPHTTFSPTGERSGMKRPSSCETIPSLPRFTTVAPHRPWSLSPPAATSSVKVLPLPDRQSVGASSIHNHIPSFCPKRQSVIKVGLAFAPA